MKFRLRSDRAGIVVLAVVIAVLPAFLSNRYFYDVAILVALNAIVCVGLNLLIGYAGQISLGHAGFFGMGAYGVAILAGNYAWPPPVALVVVLIAVALVAVAVGRPILRLRGHYLAMATLALGMIVSIALVTEDRITGGPDGMAVVPLGAFGLTLADEHAWYWTVGLLLLAVVWGARNLIDSPIGRALRALHGAEVAAAVAGVDAARFKLLAFALSAVLAALAGALTAHYAGFITPAQAGFLHSIELVTMVVFGGMASIFGAVVGAAVLTTLPQFLTAFKDYEMIVLGAIMMGTMIAMPRGLVPTLARAFRAATRREAGDEEPRR